MSDPNTLRILEIDGGGQRGYFSLNWLDKFIQLWGIDPTTIASNFDIICGTSVGGIMALSIANGMTPSAMYPFFTTQGPYIFSLSSLFASYRPSLVYKTALVATNTPFYQSSGLTAPYYGAGLLQATVQSTFGSKTLQNLNTNVIITAYQQDTSTFTLFSNASVSGYIGQSALVSDVALATSAAPVYLPAWTIGSHTYIDGGVYNNNPSQFGISLGKILKPNAKRICLLSIGTGLGEYGFDPSGNDDPPSDCTDERMLRAYDLSQKIKLMETTGLLDPNAFSTISQIFGLFTLASVGGQESVAEGYRQLASYTGSQFFTYRFNATLDPTKDTELDSTGSTTMSYYQSTAQSLFSADTVNITSFLGHLTA
jgi:uncharacterized protein